MSFFSVSETISSVAVGAGEVAMGEEVVEEERTNVFSGWVVGFTYILSRQE
jgi:hypothetical protein